MRLYTSPSAQTTNFELVDRQISFVLRKILFNVLVLKIICRQCKLSGSVDKLDVKNCVINLVLCLVRFVDEMKKFPIILY